MEPSHRRTRALSMDSYKNNKLPKVEITKDDISIQKARAWRVRRHQSLSRLPETTLLRNIDKPPPPPKKVSEGSNSANKGTTRTSRLGRLKHCASLDSDNSTQTVLLDPRVRLIKRLQKSKSIDYEPGGSAIVKVLTGDAESSTSSSPRSSLLQTTVEEPMRICHTKSYSGSSTGSTQTHDSIDIDCKHIHDDESPRCVSFASSTTQTDFDSDSSVVLDAPRIQTLPTDIDSIVSEFNKIAKSLRSRSTQSKVQRRSMNTDVCSTHTTSDTPRDTRLSVEGDVTVKKRSSSRTDSGISEQESVCECAEDIINEGRDCLSLDRPPSKGASRRRSARCTSDPLRQRTTASQRASVLERSSGIEYTQSEAIAEESGLEMNNNKCRTISLLPLRPLMLPVSPKHSCYKRCAYGKSCKSDTVPLFRSHRSPLDRGRRTSETPEGDGVIHRSPKPHISVLGRASSSAGFGDTNKQKSVHNNGDIPSGSIAGKVA